MRILFLVFITMTSFSVNGFSDAVNPDQEYVWARSGLNVRSGPGTNFDIVEKLAFGDSVIVISETEISYNITGIAEADTTQYYVSRYEKKEPYILYGNWIEVYTASGKVGYVVSPYIIDVKPNVLNEECPFEEVKRDTLALYDEVESFETSIAIQYKNDIKGSITGNKACYGNGYSVPNVTIQEAFVMLMNSEIKGLRVVRNWPNELILDDGYYSISFILKDDGLYYSMMGCC